MGATTFRTIATGRTAEDAYNRACEQAEFEYGHDPYNGTISTTSGFVSIPKPPRCRATKLASWVFAAQDAHQYDRDIEYFSSNENDLTPWERRELKEARSNVKAAWKKVPEQHRELAVRFCTKIDKFGPAGCIEVTGKEAKSVQRRRGEKVFLFFGWAAM